MKPPPILSPTAFAVGVFSLKHGWVGSGSRHTLCTLIEMSVCIRALIWNTPLIWAIKWEVTWVLRANSYLSTRGGGAVPHSVRGWEASVEIPSLDKTRAISLGILSQCINMFSVARQVCEWKYHLSNCVHVLCLCSLVNRYLFIPVLAAGQYLTGTLHELSLREYFYIRPVLSSAGKTIFYGTVLRSFSSSIKFT